uniref:Putative terminase n=1 Tax=viral metagenome TaxID=1070528 RepID=A0A6M3K2A3_9ZZZZ
MLTSKQEKFALNLFKGLTQRESWIQAGYSDRYVVAWIDSHACRLANSGKIKSRLQELRSAVAKDDVASFEERQRILTELARGNLLDYQEQGADGGYLNIGKESPNTRAISEITTTTRYDSDGAGSTLISKVKLHSPTQAIDLLNKMDKVYSDGNPIVNDNRVINFIVSDTRRIEGIARRLDGIKELEDAIEG